MKPTHLFLVVLVAAAAGAGGWMAAKHSHASTAEDATAESANVYSCSMHPQVRSKKPGVCPFCGMALAPLNTLGASVRLPAGSVMLGSNRVQVLNVQTTVVRRQSMRRTLRVAGMIDDNDARHRLLSAYVDGRIDRLFINFTGAEVHEGEPLATIYSPKLIEAEREYVALLNHKAPGHSAVIQETQTRLLEGALQRLRRLGMNDKQIAAVPAKAAESIHSDILAPFSGTVVNRLAYEGQYVKEGDKLFELADFSTMWFRFDVYERDLAWVKPGQTVEITTPSVPGMTWVAPIAFIDPNLSDPTRSAKVRVELANPLITTNGPPHRALLHKLYGAGRVELEAPHVLAIPRTAVLDAGRPSAYVDKGGGVYDQRELKLGRAGDEFWEVLDGLREGEHVVTTGNLLIDAQSQLDRAGGSPAPPADEVAWKALSGEQLRASAEFLAAADRLAAALAADDLKEFNTQVGTMAPIMENLTLLTNVATWQPVVAKLQSARLESATDLKGARKNFYPFSMATVEFARGVSGGIASEIHLFQCPMTDKAVPGAPKTGLWFQQSPQIHNPFFGAEMIDCGTEIKP